MNRFLVTYDISADERRLKVFQCLKGWGTHIQYSVFTCDLSLSQQVKLKSELRSFIHHDEDQILLFDLGPTSGRALDCVTCLGLAYKGPVEGPIII